MLIKFVVFVTRIDFLLCLSIMFLVAVFSLSGGSLHSTGAEHSHHSKLLVGTGCKSAVHKATSSQILLCCCAAALWLAGSCQDLQHGESFLFVGIHGYVHTEAQNVSLFSWTWSYLDRWMSDFVTCEQQQTTTTWILVISMEVVSIRFKSDIYKWHFWADSLTHCSRRSWWTIHSARWSQRLKWPEAHPKVPSMTCYYQLLLWCCQTSCCTMKPAIIAKNINQFRITTWNCL